MCLRKNYDTEEGVNGRKVVCVTTRMGGCAVEGMRHICCCELEGGEDGCVCLDETGAMSLHGNLLSITAA